MILFSLPRRMHCRISSFSLFFIRFEFGSFDSSIFPHFWINVLCTFCALVVHIDSLQVFAFLHNISMFLSCYFSFGAKIICPNYCASASTYIGCGRTLILIAIERLWSKEASNFFWFRLEASIPFIFLHLFIRLVVENHLYIFINELLLIGIFGRVLHRTKSICYVHLE